MRILSVCITKHDISFAVYDNNTITFFEVERYFKDKHYFIPDNEIGWEKADIAFKRFFEMTKHTYYDVVTLSAMLNETSKQTLILILNEYGIGFGEIQTYHHQLCHASSVYFTSESRDSILLSIDGVGNCFTTLYNAKDKNISLLANANYSFGHFYEDISSICLKADNQFTGGTLEGKFMAWQSYGKFNQEMYDEMDMMMKNFIVSCDFISFNLREVTYNFIFNLVKTFQSKGFDDHDIGRTFHMWWINSILDFIKPYADTNRDLCFAGGCALNCELNYFLVKKGWFKNIYWTPVSNDTGQSLGALLLYLKEWHENLIYIGLDYGDEFDYEKNI